MRLDELLAAATRWPGTAAATVHGDASVDVDDVVFDSRAARPGTLSCCLRGRRHDGHDHAPEAVANGATALVVERLLDVAVPQVLVPSTREAMGPLAAVVHGVPSESMAVLGVTGTNGKTTTVHLLGSMLEGAGWPTEVIGTLSGARTTPEGPDLQRALAAARDAGRRAVAMEVSSHALVDHRVDGTHFRVAAFTNLSRDHLDFHGTMAQYFQAKALLFEPALADSGVVNLDDPYGRLLRDAAHIPTAGFGRDELSEVEPDRDGTSFTWRGARFRVPLAGAFNLDNALCALAVAVQLGLEPGELADGLAAAEPVPGRFEVIDVGQPFLVAVDFAHTPDGLEQLLAAGRQLAGEGRLLVVFGAGGDRDPSKRPLMGEVAAVGADRVFLTSDNPRGEDPQAIIEAVRSGMTDLSRLTVEPDRRAAIAAALAEARHGDVVLVAGKGHETTQTIGEVASPFDDRAVVRELLS